MPVVTVLAEPVGDPAALLSDLADTIARALGLGDGDVIASFVASGPTIVSGSSKPASTWPVVSIHGRDRGAAKMEAARAAAEASVRSSLSAANVEHGGVWVEWVTPLPVVE